MARLDELKTLITTAYGSGEPSKDYECMIGGYLNEAFHLLPRGKFGQWVKDNLPIPSTQCYNYKWIYNRLQGDTPHAPTQADLAETVRELRETVQRLEAKIDKLLLRVS